MKTCHIPGGSEESCIAKLGIKIYRRRLRRRTAAPFLCGRTYNCGSALEALPFEWSFGRLVAWWASDAKINPKTDPETAPNRPKIGPKSSPKRSKIEPKSASWGVRVGGAILSPRGGPRIGPRGGPWAAPGSSWARLGPSWGGPGASRGRLGRVLGPPGGVLGRPGGVLGPSWGVPEPSWASFLASFSEFVFGAILEAIFLPFWTIWGAKLERKNHPNLWRL